MVVVAARVDEEDAVVVGEDVAMAAVLVEDTEVDEEAVMEDTIEKDITREDTSNTLCAP